MIQKIHHCPAIEKIALEPNILINLKCNSYVKSVELLSGRDYEGGPSVPVRHCPSLLTGPGAPVAPGGGPPG